MSNKYLFIDIESTGVNEHKDKLHGIAYLTEEDEAFYAPIWDLPAALRAALADSKIIKVGHNLRFDLRFLAANGILVNGPIFDTMLLAQLIDENQPLGLKPLSEKYLGTHTLRNKRALDEACSTAGVKHVGGLAELDLLSPARPYYSVISAYAKEDICNTFKLFHIFTEKLKSIDASVKKVLNIPKGPLDYYLKEIVPTEKVLLSIENEGVLVNPSILDVLKAENIVKRDECLKQLTFFCEEEVRLIEEDLYLKTVESKKSPKGKAAVQRRSEKYKTLFNWESTTQVGKLFYERLGLKEEHVQKTDKGSFDMSETALKNLRFIAGKESKLRHILPIYAEFKKTLKLINTYTGDSESGMASHIVQIMTKIPAIGYSGPSGFGMVRDTSWDNEKRIFAKYPQQTVTGRLSSKDPNMQNLKRGSIVKRLFVPKEGHIFAYFDFSQVELRIAAHLSKDVRLVEAFTEGIDLHRQTAAAAFQKDIKDVTKEERQAGKTINFLLIYNGGAGRLMDELKNKNGLNYSIEQCRAFREAYFQQYPGYKAFLDQTLKFLGRYKRVVAENGRIRRLPDMVYGDFLNWKQKQFTGPQEMVNVLKKYIYANDRNPNPTDEDIFWAANRKYGHAVKQGYNFVVQSVGATITKMAMIQLHKKGYKIMTQVHDSLVIQLPIKDIDKAADIKHIMENAYKISVPLVAEMKLLNSLDESDVYQPSTEKDTKNNVG